MQKWYFLTQLNVLFYNELSLWLLCTKLLHLLWDWSRLCKKNKKKENIKFPSNEGVYFEYFQRRGQGEGLSYLSEDDGVNSG